MEDDSKVVKWEKRFQIDQTHHNIFGPSWLKTHEEFIILMDEATFLMINLQRFANLNQHSPVYDMKWGHFDRINSTFKMLLSSWNFDTVFKKIRSFDAKKFGSVD